MREVRKLAHMQVNNHAPGRMHGYQGRAIGGPTGYSDWSDVGMERQRRGPLPLRTARVDGKSALHRIGACASTDSSPAAGLTRARRSPGC
jgi:hypothetical protein